MSKMIYWFKLNFEPWHKTNIQIMLIGGTNLSTNQNYSNQFIVQASYVCPSVIFCFIVVDLTSSAIFEHFLETVQFFQNFQKNFFVSNKMAAHKSHSQARIFDLSQLLAKL